MMLTFGKNCESKMTESELRGKVRDGMEMNEKKRKTNQGEK